MNIALWIIQSVVSLAFFGAGAAKLAKGREALLADKHMAWANDFRSSHIKLIGLAEVLGAVGLILPVAMHMLPVLTPIAGAGLAILMAGAVATHIRRHEAAAVPVVLGLLSAFVAVGRLVVA